mgnify:CR=1 FL=1
MLLAMAELPEERSTSQAALCVLFMVELPSVGSRRIVLADLGCAQ